MIWGRIKLERQINVLELLKKEGVYGDYYIIIQRKMEELLLGKYNILSQSDEEIVIFGTGTNGKILKEILKTNKINVKAYIVGDDQKKIVSEIDGIPVYKISEFKKNIVNSTTVIVTVREGIVKEKVLLELENAGFLKIKTADDYTDWVNILDYYYSSYFRNHNIDIDKDIININGDLFHNGFKLDVEGKYSFLVELGDIILPKFFDDYTICNEGPYELEDIGFNIQSNDIVLDCGANMGLFTTIAANLCKKVYAFEPVPHTREYLDKVKNIYPDKIDIVPYALSNKIGETTFFIGSDMNGENSIDNLSGSCKNSINVHMDTIDNYVFTNEISDINFIKADIEGAERNMLLGATRVLQEFEPKLTICTYHLKDDPEIIENIIKKANPRYKIIHRYKKLYAYV